MIANFKPSTIYPAGLANAIFPQSVAAAGVVTSPWVAVPTGARWAIVRLWTGVLGGGSEQVDLEQAKDAAGTGAKTMVLALRVAAVNSQQYDDEASLDNVMDINNGYAFVRVKVTNTGGTGALLACGFSMGPPLFLG
jgi:hypothetical protein